MQTSPGRPKIWAGRGFEAFVRELFDVRAGRVLG